MGLQFVVEHEADLTLPENRSFRAQLKEIKLNTFTWTDHSNGAPVQKEGATLQWWWEVQSSDEYNGRKVKGECEPRISDNPRNRFRSWSETLLQRDIPMGLGIDTDDLVGLTANITIRHRADKKDPSKKYEEVSQVLPLSGDGGTGWGTEPPPF